MRKTLKPLAPFLTLAAAAIFAAASAPRPATKPTTTTTKPATRAAAIPKPTALTAQLVAGTYLGRINIAPDHFQEWLNKTQWKQLQTENPNDHVAADSLRISITLAPNGDFLEEIHDSKRAYDTLKGKWSLLPPGPPAATAPASPGVPGKIRVTLAGAPPADIPLSFNPNDDMLYLNAPGMAAIGLDPDVFLMRQYEGLPPTVDFNALRTQATKWITDNAAPNADPKALLNPLSTAFQQLPDHNLYIDLGASLLKQKHAAMLTIVGGKLAVLPYSDPQAKAAGLLPDAYRTIVPPRLLTLAAPEVKLESVTFDSKNTLSLRGPVTGKIAFRILTTYPNSRFSVALSHPRANTFAPLDATPTSTLQTLPFSFNEILAPEDLANVRLPNPLPVTISIVRSALRQPTADAPKKYQVSEPLTAFMEVVP